MAIIPMFARYIRAGDNIGHPTRGTFGRVVTARHDWGSPAWRPWGTVSGWMENPDNPAEHWGWSYPADALLPVVRT